MLIILMLSAFFLGYLAITLEHSIKVNKSAVALATGGVLWVLAAIYSPEGIEEALMHAGAEIFEITVFLLAAMSLVEVLVHYQFFDVLQSKIQKLNFQVKGQFLLIIAASFFLSAVIDNLTTTIVMLLMAKQFFKGKNLLVTAAGIVVAANAGGAFSPLGDVTTIMLWLADKFSTTEIILYGFLPSLVMILSAGFLLYRQIDDKQTIQHKTEEIILAKSERIVVFLVFTSFILALAMNSLDLPPYLGLLIGLGIIWIVTDVFKQLSERKTHMEVSLDKLIQRTDLASLKFFIGILLAVSALGYVGVLDVFGHLLYGAMPTFNRIVMGNVVLGMASAIFDNVPLTAMTIGILPTTNSILWVLLAITVGVGGSFLVIGSAAGVIAMGSIKGLNFKTYFKMAFVPVLVGYFLAVATWYGQLLVTGHNLEVNPTTGVEQAQIETHAP